MGDTIWFASEIRALLQDPALDRTINPAAIVAYLELQYVPHPMSAFLAIEKLPPATVMSFSLQGSKSRRYWTLDYRQKRPVTPETGEELRRLIWEATRIRLMSEVPLGAFLSGGIDSSAVVAAMADQSSEAVKTFSIGFEEDDYDELRYARTVAERFATDHHEFIVRPRALEIMPTIARH